jgi:hypothetical protein
MEELAAKNQINSYKDEFLIFEKRITAILSQERPNIKHEHIIQLPEIDNVLKSIKNLEYRINEIDIPKEIEIIKTNKVQIDDKTRLFILYWLGISTVVTALAIIYGASTYTRNEELNRIEQEKGVFIGRNNIYNVSTKAGQERIDRLYPDWNKKIK